MNPEIAKLKQKAKLCDADVQQFLAENSFPLVEETGVTFVYSGPADAVYLQHWVYGLPSTPPLERLDGTDLWHLWLELPEKSRIEYKFDVVRGDENSWITDPLNPLQAHDPFGSNSVCHGYGYETPDWTLPNADSDPGRLDELSLRSRAFGGERTLRVYRPARFRRSRRYPLLIVHDGEDFLRYGGMSTALDNLIYRRDVPPMIVALIDAHDRLTEYPDNPRHARFLTDELLPHLQERYPLLEKPASRALMGASFGAVAALSAAWRYPGVYDRLLLNSGSFTFTRRRRGPAFVPVQKFVKAFRKTPGKPAERAFVSCGIYEPLIHDNRVLVPMLREHGMQVHYVEANDGHNWESWRDQLRNGLTWLFPSSR